MNSALPSPNSGNVRLMDSVLGAKIGLAFLAFADRLNLIVGKSPIPMPQAARRSLLGLHIKLILCGRAKFQMLRIYAWRIVASMHNNLAFRNWPYQEFVDVSMGLGALPSCACARCDNTIPVGGVIASPEPTGFRFLDPSLYGDRRNYTRVVLQSARAKFFHVAKLAKIATVKGAFAKKAFFSHVSLRGSNRDMTIPCRRLYAVL